MWLYEKMLYCLGDNSTECHGIMGSRLFSWFHYCIQPRLLLVWRSHDMGTLSILLAAQHWSHYRGIPLITGFFSVFLNKPLNQAAERRIDAHVTSVECAFYYWIPIDNFILDAYDLTVIYDYINQTWMRNTEPKWDHLNMLSLKLLSCFVMFCFFIPFTTVWYSRISCMYNETYVSLTFLCLRAQCLRYIYTRITRSSINHIHALSVDGNNAESNLLRSAASDDWGLNKMTDDLQRKLSDAFSWKKMFGFRFRYH